MPKLDVLVSQWIMTERMLESIHPLVAESLYEERKGMIEQLSEELPIVFIIRGDFFGMHEAFTGLEKHDNIIPYWLSGSYLRDPTKRGLWIRDMLQMHKDKIYYNPDDVTSSAAIKNLLTETLLCPEDIIEPSQILSVGGKFTKAKLGSDGTEKILVLAGTERDKKYLKNFFGRGNVRFLHFGTEGVKKCAGFHLDHMIKLLPPTKKVAKEGYDGSMVCVIYNCIQENEAIRKILGDWNLKLIVTKYAYIPNSVDFTKGDDVHVFTPRFGDAFDLDGKLGIPQEYLDKHNFSPEQLKDLIDSQRGVSLEESGYKVIQSKSPLRAHFSFEGGPLCSFSKITMKESRFKELKSRRQSV